MTHQQTPNAAAHWAANIGDCYSETGTLTYAQALRAKTLHERCSPQCRIRAAAEQRLAVRSAAQCFYIDSSVSDVRQIGAIHRRMSSEFSASPTSFVLHTCQRVELYSTDTLPPPQFPEDAGVVSGRPAVLRRLTEIATGVRSQVIGERFVLRQVELAAQVPPPNPCIPLAATAVAVARSLRREYDLEASLDYPAAALKLLQRPHHDPTSTLLVVGGGMLARAVAEHGARAGYRPVVVLTRSPKRARRRFLAPAVPGIVVCGPSHIRTVLPPARWDAVIATTNLVDSYSSQIDALIDDPRCGGVVDLSAVPLRPDTTERYEHMYGPRFAALIAEQNAQLAEPAHRVRQVIAEIFRED